MARPSSRRASWITTLLLALGLVASLLPASLMTDPVRPVADTVTRLTVASFNILGDSHTEPGGKNAGMASGSARMEWTLQLMRRHDVDVAGWQEFHNPQRAAFTSLSERFRVWPGNNHPNRYKQNVVVWRTATYALVDAFTFKVPYLNGVLQSQPAVRLRDRSTGQQFWVMSVHYSPGLSGAAYAWRSEALRRHIAVTNDLLKDGIPVLSTGDFNNREITFCRYTASGAMIAAAGGSTSGRTCLPPPGRIARVDWIFGSKRDTDFSNYQFIRSPLVVQTSDHPLIVADAALR
jgi:endonuclease/exonuclease/phosphatase family metal-dependent hydrolase